METWQITLTMFGAVIIPMIGFLLLFRPFIKDTIKAELGDFKTDVTERLSRIEGRLEELGPMAQWIASQVVPKLKSEEANPNGHKNELLEKWKVGTLTYQESVELRDILAQEALQADEAKRNLIMLAYIGLATYALSLTKKSIDQKTSTS